MSARRHITSQGQTWDQIAHAIWGREDMTHHLLGANPSHRRTVFFAAGVELIVPALTPPASEEPPPWQQR